MKNLKMWSAFFFFACAILSAFLYMWEEIPYVWGKAESEKLAKAYVSWVDGGSEEGEKNEHLTSPGIWTMEKSSPEVDFTSLKEINPDIIGWIYISGTKVNYPILRHSKSDDYYLSHTPEKKLNKLGSIYMHHDSDSGFLDAHTILYGHNMRSGQMFGELSNYRDSKFAEAHSDIWICLPEETLHCTVYSAYVCGVEDLTYTIGYALGGKRYGDFIRHTVEKSCFDIGKCPTDRERVITLSTCTDSGDVGKRFVVNCFVSGVQGTVSSTEK